jgi:hypothetical protein
MRLVVAVALVVIGCGATRSDPEQACVDAADAAAKAGARCGWDEGQTRTNFISEAAAGSCKNIVAVRDEMELRTTCFNWLATTSCTNITRYSFMVGQPQPLDASCVHQLIRGADASID